MVNSLLTGIEPVKEYIKKMAGETGQLTSSRILDEYREQIDTYQPPVLTEKQQY